MRKAVLAGAETEDDVLKYQTFEESGEGAVAGLTMPKLGKKDRARENV